MKTPYDEGFESYQPGTIYDPKTNKHRGAARKEFANGWSQAMWNWLVQYRNKNADLTGIQ